MRTCDAEGCEQPVGKKGARGLCSLHYKRLMRHGDVHASQRAPVATRFFRYFTRGGADECWEWTGGRDRDGYGSFTDGNGRPTRAHRFAYYLSTGEALTSDVHIRHTCDNPPCVNPAHLLPGRNVDNVRDKVQRGRQRGNTTGHLGDLARRLTDEDVRAIREATGSYPSIGRVYGVSAEHVRRIKNRTRRQDVA